MTAPCFIQIFCSDDYAFMRIGRSLRSVRRVSAYHAYCQGLCNVFSDREKLRHRLEGLAAIVLVESRNDHALSGIRKLFADVDNIRSEELSFIDADNLRVGGEVEYLIACVYDGRNERLLAVRNNVARAVAVVDSRFKDHYSLTGNLRAPHPAYQFFRLSAEHASGNNFDPTCIFRRGVGAVFHERENSLVKVSLICGKNINKEGRKSKE